MQKKYYPLFLFFLISTHISSQNITSTIRGTIQDALTKQPLIGATVQVLNISSSAGSTTNETGNFFINKIPVGRYEVEISYLGYETLLLSETLLEAGKEKVLEINLSESTAELQQVVVKSTTQNTNISPLSNHEITIEEVQRFPATFFDPARLAMLYPGVAGTNDQANGLSIRGLPPSLLQWRLEGVEIVNPNHLSNAGTISDQPSVAAGGVNILSAQMLDNSRLFTGAFPVEYSNVLGGVMDMRLRKGNNQQHEFTAQAGLLGFDLGMEGPFSQKSKASFLFNYRYSFTGLLTNFGIDFDGEEIGFEDVSFNLNFPTKKAGNFMIFGIGGRSNNFKAALPEEEWEESKDSQQIDYQSTTGIIGATHSLALNSKAVWTTNFGHSIAKTEYDIFDNNQFFSKLSAPAKESITSGSTNLSIKLSPSFQLKSGIQIQHHFVKDGLNAFLDGEDFSDIPLRKSKLNYLTPFIKFNGEVFKKFHFSIGSHLNYLTGTREIAPVTSPYTTGKSITRTIDTRGSLSWQATPSQRISYYAGQHSGIFYLERNIFIQNPNDGWFFSGYAFTKSFQQSLKYEVNNVLNGKLGIELFYQTIKNIPLTNQNATPTLISSVNIDDISIFNYDRRGVENYDGKSKSYGLELLFQRQFSNNLYFFFSGALYDAKYLSTTDSDSGKYFSNRFNGQWNSNLIFGKEFTNSKKTKFIVYGGNIRTNYRGGFRERVPVEFFNNGNIRRYSDNFDKQLPNFFRIDLRFYIKWNKLNTTTTLSLDLQNATNHQNVAYNYFDTFSKEIKTQYQLGLIPLLNYRIEF